MVPGSTRAAACAAVAAIIALLPGSACAQGIAAPSPPPIPPPAQAPDPASPLDPLPDLGVAWPDLDTGDAAAPALPAAAAASAELRRYRVVITGAEDLGGGFRARFNQLSALVAGESKPANAAQIDRRARDDEALADQLLRSFGRYDGSVATTVSRDAAGTVVRLAIEPGPAYRFATVAVPGLEAAGAAAPALREALAIAPGDAVDADHVQAAIAAFRARLGREGFPFAKVADPEIIVDHAADRASFALPVALGERARFGRIVASGPRHVFSAHHLGQIARFHAGDRYDSAMLEDLRRALIQTGLVSVATVTPVASATPGVVDVAVHTERAPPRTIAGQLGYGTGEGISLQASWQHRNLIPPEGAVTFAGVLGTREQSLSATLRRANLRRRDHVLNAQIAASHTNLNAYDARSLDLSASIERQTNIIWQKTWSWSAGGEFLATDERDTIQATGQPRRRTFLVAAVPASLAYDGSDDLLNPTRGYRLSLRVSPEASLHGRFDGYLKLQFDASAYLPVGSRMVFAGRVRLGGIEGAATADIAPSRRFYAGGGGSVRGFGYQKIGPVDIDGNPVGGRGLAEAAIEARIRFGNFGVVPFLDAGSLDQSSVPRFGHLRYGTGLGVRYYSSFGPIRVDVGTPIARRPGESRVAVYVSLGQAF